MESNEIDPTAYQTIRTNGITQYTVLTGDNPERIVVNLGINDSLSASNSIHPVIIGDSITTVRGTTPGVGSSPFTVNFNNNWSNGSSTASTWYYTSNPFSSEQRIKIDEFYTSWDADSKSNKDEEPFYNFLEHLTITKD